MLFITLAILTLYLVITGWGLFLERLLHGNIQTKSSSLITILYGYFALCLLGSAIHLFFPITSALSLTIQIVGFCLLLLLCLKNGSITRTIGKEILIGAPVALLIGFVIQHNEFFLFDMGIYYLQNIQWIQESPLVLGLAHMEGKFGFHSNWFILASIIESPILLERSGFLINGLFITSFFITCIKKLITGLQKSFFATSDLFLIGCMSGIFLIGLSPVLLSSQSADLAVVLITFTIIYLWLRHQHGSENTRFLFNIILITFLALTIKLSTIPLGLSIFIITYLVATKRAVVQTRSITSILLLGFLLLILWMIHNFAASGCFLYPVSWSCFPKVSWSVLPHVPVEETKIIQSWARAPKTPVNEVLINWNWMEGWVKRLLNSSTVRLLLGFLVIHMVSLLHSSKRMLDYYKATFIPIILLLVGFLFWFTTSPAPRFGYGYLYSLGLLLFVGSLNQIEVFYKKATLIIGLALFTLYLSISQLPRDDIQINMFQWPRIPTTEVIQRKTLDETPVNTPKAGIKCWNAAIPCASFFRDDLKSKKHPLFERKMFYRDNST